MNPPNWFTSASIFCSVYALSLIMAADSVTPEVLSRACVLVIFGGIFDLLDGGVARMTRRFSEFGVQLDSQQNDHRFTKAFDTVQAACNRRFTQAKK